MSHVRGLLSDLLIWSPGTPCQSCFRAFVANWYDYERRLAPAIVFGILYMVDLAEMTYQLFNYSSWALSMFGALDDQSRT